MKDSDLNVNIIWKNSRTNLYVEKKVQFSHEMLQLEDIFDELDDLDCVPYDTLRCLVPGDEIVIKVSHPEDK